MTDPTATGAVLMAPAEPVATCRGLVRLYRTETEEVQALRGVDLVVEGGIVTAVTGPSGSGKSTLLRILAGFDEPTGGSAVIDGTELAGLPARERHRLRRESIAYVFQRPSDNLVPHLTAREHLVRTAWLRGGDPDRADELLGRVGLSARAAAKPTTLSGGEQQRLAFAQALASPARLVLADEPTAELDRASALRITELLAELAADGAGVVVTTHDPRVSDAADTAIALRHGTVESEVRGGKRLAVIDAVGRVQLPLDALNRFPDRRVVISDDAHGVRLTTP